MREDKLQAMNGYSEPSYHSPHCNYNIMPIDISRKEDKHHQYFCIECKELTFEAKSEFHK